MSTTQDAKTAPQPLSSERLAYWQRKLGRIRLGVEPIDEQLARFKRITWGLTAVPVLIACIIVAIFTAFGAPLVGLGAVAIIFGPVIALAWFDYLSLSRRVAAYQREIQGQQPDSPSAATNTVPVPSRGV